MTSTGATTLVGRERHVRELGRLVDAALSGNGYAVLLTGEAGAGKTTLAEEAARLATMAEAGVAWVTCWRNAAAPLTVWDDLFEAAAGGVAYTSPPSWSGDPESARAVHLRALARQLLDAIETPTLLVVDDLQWADALSVRAIEALGGVLRAHAVGLVCTARDDGADAAAVPVGRLSAKSRHLVVPPLTKSELATLALDVAGVALSTTSLTLLHDRSAGNVLFARELLANPDGATRGHDGRTSAAAATVAIFTERLATLTAPCQRVLQTASVIGRLFRLDLVAEALGDDADALLPLIAEAELCGLVRSSGLGGFEFCHPLIAEACYTAGGLPRRVRLHRDVAEAMERLREQGVPIPAAEIAHHYAVASASGVALKAAAWASLAGREDMAQLAYEDAVRDFSLALRAHTVCGTDDRVVADLHLALGDAHAATGNREAAREAYGRAASMARRRGWPDLLARAALGFSSGPGGFEIAPFDREQIALLEEASAHAPAPQRPLVLARLSVARALDPRAVSRRVALSEEALRAARDSGDDAAIGYALASWCDVIPGPDERDRRLEATDEILRCAATLGDTRLELLGRRLRVVALLEAGRIEDFDQEVDAFASSADRIGQPLYSWYVPLWRAMRASMDGRLKDAERLRQSAAAIGAAASSDNARLLVDSQRAMLDCELGTATTETTEFFGRIIEQYPDYAIMARPGLAYGLASTGDIEEARKVIATLEPSIYTVDTLGSELLSTLMMAAHAGWLAKEDRHADALYAALLPHRSVFAVDGIAGYMIGSVERYLALLAVQRGDLELARAHFDAALEAHRGVRSPVLVAGTLRDAGACLEDHQLSAQAAATYTTLGVTGAARPSMTQPAGFAFRRAGDAWQLTWTSETVHVRHSKGMADIARLLAAPKAEFHVLDLVDTGPNLVEHAAGDPIDGTARRLYRARLEEIDGDLEEADRNGDVGLSQRLHQEREALLAELSSAYGLGGRARKRSDSSERARSAVTQRVRDAIARIEQAHPALGQHLRHSVRTGTFCAYEPERHVDWRL